MSIRRQCRNTGVSLLLGMLVFFSFSVKSLAFHGEWDVYSHLDDVIKYSFNKFSDVAKQLCSSPVYGQRGEFFWPEEDISLAGRPALSVSRTYNSLDPTSGMFGNGWTSNCDIRLIKTRHIEASGTELSRSFTRYILRSSDGRRRLYDEQSDGSVKTPAARYDRVVPQSGGNVRLVQQTGNYQEFNSRGRLVRKVDRNGNTVDYAYDANGRLSSLADTHGRSIGFTYDSSGHVSALTDHTTRAWRFTYDANGNLISRTDPLGGVRSYDYQAFTDPLNDHIYNQLTRVTDESGVVLVSAAYEGMRVVSYTEGENQFDYTYNTNNSTTKQDLAGSTWTYTYNDNGAFDQIRLPESRTVRYVTDENGDVINYTDEQGYLWQYTYDERGNLTSTTNPLEETLRISYVEGLPWVAETTSPSARVDKFSYDVNGNPVRYEDPVGAVTQMEWNASGDLVAVVDAEGSRHIYEYHAAGQIVKDINSEGEVRVYTYDSLGRMVSSNLPGGETTTLVYDALDRITQIIDSLGQTTGYSLDPVGRLSLLTDSRGFNTTFEYDEYGRQLSQTRPDGAITSYTYQVDNLPATITDPRGVVTTNRYDSAKRLAKAVVGTESISYNYDRRGMINYANSPDATVRFDYDKVGHLVRETNGAQRFDYTYNSEGEIVTFNYGSESWQYDRDARGQLTALTTSRGVHTFRYDSLGRQVQHTLPNNRTVTMAYDTVGRLLAQDDSPSGGAAFNYSYDSNGRLSLLSGDGVSDWTYQYDPINRLTSASHEQAYNYSYDQLGNRLDQGGQYDAFNKLISDNQFVFEYDLAGNTTRSTNLVTGEITTYTYNDRGRLFSISIAADEISEPSYTATYGYDAFGRRHTAVINNLRTYYYWAGDRLISKFGGEFKLRAAKYTYGDTGWSALEFSDENGTYYTQEDNLGTPRYLTDDTGQTVWQNRVSPYGVAQLQEDVDGDGFLIKYDQRFPGQYEDEVTGLYNNRLRYYNPELGRYTRSDPIGINGGPNNYIYAKSDPKNNLDPMGLRSNPLVTLTQYSPISQAVAFVYSKHYGRNVNNMDVSFQYAQDNWDLQSPGQSGLHRVPGSGVTYLKFTHKSGYEAVFNPVIGQRVTDPTIMGTYHYGKKWFSHIFLDMLPSATLGNSPEMFFAKGRPEMYFQAGKSLGDGVVDSTLNRLTGFMNSLVCY